MTRFTLVILLSLLKVYSFAQQTVNLKVEYSTKPIGLDQLKPRFSWQITSNIRNAKQSSYQILVASNEDNLKKDNGDIWNSGKVISDQSLFVEFKGKTLESRKRYFWKVKTWNEKSKVGNYSEPSFWEMGLLNKTDWQANWIGKLGTEGKPPKAIDLQKEFKLEKRAIKARIYVTGLGAYQIGFNGKRIGNDILTPGWTNYLKTINYQTYEIDPEQLSVGANFITASVGNAWFSSGLGWGGGNNRYSEDPNRLFFQMELTFYDGGIQTIASDATWQTRLSPITENSLYGGENYDARLEYNKEWSKADVLDDITNKTTLYNVMFAKEANEEIFSTKNIKLTASKGAQIKVEQEIKAISLKEVKKGKWVYDFGQNLVGFCKLKVEGKAGKEVEIKFAELLDKKGMVDQANLRGIFPTDKYILKGYGIEEWEPKFTYHGFRYAELSGYQGKPDLNSIVAKVIHTESDVTGTFSCSNELLNQIQKNITWGQRGNMMSVPTDCPQRDERLGWMGDAQIFATTASYNMDMNSFFAKWERDIVDSQDPSGYVHDVNPKIVIGGPAKPAWGDAVVIIPYKMYQMYGDKRIIDENYDALKAWVEFMNNHENTRKNGIYHFESAFDGKPFYGFGDWVPVVNSPTKPIGGAYQYYSNKILAEMAKVIGKSGDFEKYNNVAKNTTIKYNHLYFNTTTKDYEGATQAANLIPLNFGIAPENEKSMIIKNIVKNVKDNNDHLTTGFLATQMLLPALSDNGHHELAYKVATQKTYPSWGYMVEKGATSMWELWNSDTEKPEGMNSRNHFAYGSVGEWYFGYLAGIKQDINAVGFKKIIISPKPAGDLTFVEGNYKTNYGLIKSRWDLVNKKFKLAIEIPVNTSCEVKIPTFGNTKAIIKESGKVLKPKAISASEAIFEIGSGSWNFEMDVL